MGRCRHPFATKCCDCVIFRSPVLHSCALLASIGLQCMDNWLRFEICDTLRDGQGYIVHDCACMHAAVPPTPQLTRTVTCGNPLVLGSCGMQIMLHSCKSPTQNILWLVHKLTVQAKNIQEHSPPRCIRQPHLTPHPIPSHRHATPPDVPRVPSPYDLKKRNKLSTF